VILTDRKTIENFAAVVQSVEQMKLLTILTTADIRGVGARRVERLGRRNCCARSIPRPSGADRRLFGSRPRPARAMAQANSAKPSPTGRSRNSILYRASLSGGTGSRSSCLRKIRHARFMRASEQEGSKARDQCRFRRSARVTELTILAIDHRGCFRSSPAHVPPRAPTSSMRRSTRDRRACTRHHSDHAGIRSR